MSTTKVILNDGKTEQTVVIRNASVADIVDELSNGAADESTVLENLLSRTGIDLSVERPDSSWIDRIQYSVVNGEVTFVAQDGAVMSYPMSLSDYLNGVRTGEGGRWYWRVKRAFDAGK